MKMTEKLIATGLLGVGMPKSIKIIKKHSKI